MSNPKRQHWLPRFYLRYFATPETRDTDCPLVWAVSRDKATPIEPTQAATKCVAVEKFLYSPRKSDGSRDFKLEKKFSGLEGCLAGLWPRFSGPEIELPKSMQKMLALFLATLYLRHPTQRQSIANTHRRIVEHVEADIKTLDEIPSQLTYLINGKKCHLNMDDFQSYKNAGDDEHHRAFVDYAQRGARMLAELLLKKRWSFIVSDGPVFVTCDNPMSLRGPDLTDAKFGFGTPGMTVDFPISPNVLLHLDDGKGIQICPLGTSPFTTERPCAAFNCEMWTNASRFMFCPREPYEVIQEIMDFWEFCKAHCTVNG